MRVLSIFLVVVRNRAAHSKHLPAFLATPLQQAWCPPVCGCRLIKKRTRGITRAGDFYRPWPRLVRKACFCFLEREKRSDDSSLGLGRVGLEPSWLWLRLVVAGGFVLPRTLATQRWSLSLYPCLSFPVSLFRPMVVCLSTTIVVLFRHRSRYFYIFSVLVRVAAVRPLRLISPAMIFFCFSLWCVDTSGEFNCLVVRLHTANSFRPHFVDNEALLAGRRRAAGGDWRQE